MNWHFIILQIVALLGIISFTIVAVYYVRHRHTKARSILEQQLQGETVEGGEFLKRYIPPEHRLEPIVSPRRPILANRFVFYSACMLIPLLMLVFTGSNYYANREEVLENIVLLKSEIDQLPHEKYTFESALNPYAATLPEVLASIPDSVRVAVFRKKGSSENRVYAWQELLDEYDVPFGICYQERLEDCRFRKNSTVILSLEDIDETGVERLARRGNNVIAFGVPTGIDASESYIQGLTFSSSDQPKPSRLAVVGDRELTLGIDSGSNFHVTRVGGNAHVASDRPQAISMYSDGIAGGDVQTRVYATLVETENMGNSRVAWMDFMVDDRHYLDGAEKKSFESLLAGIVRYGTEQQFGALATWPEGHRYAAFFEEDTEDGYENAVEVSDFFEDLGMPITWYVLSNLANNHRAVTRKLAGSGEVACHGDNHDIMTRYTVEGQVERLARCMKVVAEITGQVPTGFRPPTEAHDANTLSAMANVGLTHLFAENTAMTQVPHFKRSTSGGKYIVSLPRGISDDFYLWHDLKLGKKRSIDRMQDELNWIREAGSLFSFSFHTQFMDRVELFEVTKHLARAVHEDEDVYVDTVGNMVNWWHFRDALMTGKPVEEQLYERYVPVMLTVGQDGMLTRSAVTGAITGPIEMADIDSEP